MKDWLYMLFLGMKHFTQFKFLPNTSPYMLFFQGQKRNIVINQIACYYITMMETT